MAADPEEFLEFANTRSGPLFRTAWLLCGDWHLAEDLVQTTLGKLFRSWRRVRRADKNDVVLYMKQGQTPAVSRHVTDPQVREYFTDEGHRTVISQRALQAHADPWLGHTTIDGVGQLVAEVSPYANDLDWSDLTDVDEIREVVTYLAYATATMHAVADEQSGHSLVPFPTAEAILGAVDKDPEGFTAMLVDFAHTYGARARADHAIFVDLFRNGLIPGV